MKIKISVELDKLYLTYPIDSCLKILLYYLLVTTYGFDIFIR